MSASGAVCPVDRECQGGPSCGWHTISLRQLYREMGLEPTAASSDSGTPGGDQ